MHVMQEAVLRLKKLCVRKMCVFVFNPSDTPYCTVLVFVTLRDYFLNLLLVSSLVKITDLKLLILKHFMVIDAMFPVSSSCNPDHSSSVHSSY